MQKREKSEKRWKMWRKDVKISAIRCEISAKDVKEEAAEIRKDEKRCEICADISLEISAIRCEIKMEAAEIKYPSCSNLGPKINSRRSEWNLELCI